MKNARYIPIAVCAILLAGCSTQKNTFITRTYHNVTSKFNYLFNAEQSFDESIRKYKDEYAYSYDALLPIFIFDKPSAKSKTSDGCDRAIMKSGLLIKYHSITAKPKSKKSATAAQQAFYNKREFCNYVDEAYLLIGKGNAFQHDYSKGRQSFDNIIFNYPESDSYSEAQLWLALLAGAENDLVAYNEALTDFDINNKYTGPIMATYNAAWADFYLKKGNLAKAIEYLDQAIAKERKKEERLRYTYILGQLYQMQEKFSEAQQCFQTVARKSRKYDMAFNAQIAEAMSFTQGNDPEVLKNVLLKMSKKTKNINYRDQIYYTIGKIYVKDGKADEALSYFKKSLEVSTDNSSQKGATFFEIGNMAYSQRDFIAAQAFYDSAYSQFSNDHPLYSEAKLRSTKLSRLANKTKEYQRCDSLLRMSRLSKDELDKIINERIAAVVAQQEKDREEQSQHIFNVNQNPLTLGTQKAAKWYFYNQSTLSIGATEFKMRWGSRKLEDNWRRKNKGNIVDLAEAKEEEERKANTDESPLSRGYYMKDLPKNADEQNKLNQQKQEALAEIADAYRIDADDPKGAIQALDQLMLDQPLGEEVTLRAYTIYYQSYLALGNADAADKYKDLIISKYPKSGMANSLANTGIANADSDKEHSQILEQCLKLLKNSDYKQCLDIADAQLRGKSSAITPQLALIRALAIGGTAGRDAYRKELADVASKYSNSEVGETASAYIQQLDKAALSGASSKQLTKSVDVTKPQPASQPAYSASNGDQEVIIILPKSTNVNQLRFNLVSFNVDTFPNTEFSIVDEDFDSENQLVKVAPFADKAGALDYYYKLLESQDLISKSGAEKFVLFTITPSNLEVLKKEKNFENYSDFFMNNYLNQ